MLTASVPTLVPTKDLLGYLPGKLNSHKALDARTHTWAGVAIRLEASRRRTPKGMATALFVRRDGDELERDAL